MCLTHAATTPAPPAAPKVEVEFKLVKNFTEDLNDPNSEEFLELAGSIEEAVSPLL